VPRQSAEARSAASFVAGGAPPRAPAHLSKAAKVLWAEIAASKPADWFDAGSGVLLGNYCEVAVQARGVAKRLERLRKATAWDEAKAWEKRLAMLTRTLSMLATKLRLSVQSSVDRKSRKLDERGQLSRKRDPLLGGSAVWGESGKPN
jgi:hypothetical protein